MKLTSYPFLNTLESEALVFLEQHIKPISIPKNTILFYQGDICDTILWLTQGEVRLYTQADSIEDITLYHLKAGEQCIVNTASLLSQTDAIASAQTMTNIEGYVIDAQSVKQLSKMSDVYQNYLFSLYQLRFEELTGLINDIKFKPLVTKVYLFGEFKLNEEKYLNYYKNNPNKPFCQVRIEPKLKVLIQKYGAYVKNKKRVDD